MAPAVCEATSKIYQSCNDQGEVYQKQFEQAKASQSVLLVQFGFESCPWCHSLHEMFSSNGFLDKFNKKITVVDIDIKADSGKKVFNTLQDDPGKTSDKFGYPYLVFVNPSNGKKHFQSTGDLEDNSNGKGHSQPKVVEAIHAALKVID